MSPNTEQVICSPISGDPDLNNQETICGIQHIAIGFLLPNPGVLTDIEMTCQGSIGTGVNRNIRYSIVQAKKDNAAPTGLAHSKTLLTGVTPVADNAVGRVVLATGLAVNVPSQFIIAVKGPLQADASSVYVQSMRSAGPVPGVVGTISGQDLISAATYTFAAVSFDATNPPIIPQGDMLTVTLYKGLAINIKWRGQ